MAWTWEIVTGKLYEDSGALIAIGYSGGDHGLDPDAVNNPSVVEEHNIGPIPPGHYTIEAPENDAHTGEYSMPLTPAPTNTMYSRSGFRIHGDNPQMNRSASDGCIILPLSIRQQIWQSGDHELDVVARMPEGVFSA